jgi:hypothetical protein
MVLSPDNQFTAWPETNNVLVLLAFIFVLIAILESILVSLPETARWEHDHPVEEGSPEADFIDACRYAREWV